MSHYRPLNFRLKERIYENDDKSIVIFKTRKKQTIKYIAVKTYVKKSYQDNYNIEYEILKDINYPSIIKVLGYAEDKYNFYMEMEFCASGNLSTLIRKNKSNLYLEKVIKMVSTQLLLGLKTLHENGIIHCNLKPSNILLDEFGNVKICDFKRTLKVKEMSIEDIKKTKTSMTPCYTAPEIFTENGIYSFKSDLWALGCIMYEMAVGQVPFIDESVNKLVNKIVNEEVDFTKNQLQNYSEQFIEVIKQLLEKNPNNRSSWGKIEKYAFWDIDQSNNNNTNFNSSLLNETKDNSLVYSLNSAIENANINSNKINITAKEDEDYSSNKNNKGDADNADQEFNFEKKNSAMNTTKEDEINKSSKFNHINTNLLSGMSISLIVSKIIDKRDKRTTIDLVQDIAQSMAKNKESPPIQEIMFHNSDRSVRQIIGNDIIEPVVKATYDIEKLEFSPVFKIDKIKNLLLKDKINEFQIYLSNIYQLMDNYNLNNQQDELLNLLNYVQTIIMNKHIANNLINTPFTELIVNFLDINNDNIRIRACNIIGYLVRYATNIEIPLDKYDLTQKLISFISDNNNINLKRKAISTLGEYLFFLATQVEGEENQTEWNISKEALSILLFALNNSDEKVKFYALKTIENISCKTTISKTYFASNDDYINKIIDIYNENCENPEIHTSALSACSHLIRHENSLLKIFLNKIDTLNIILEKETQKNQQFIINCLLFGIVYNEKNVEHLKIDDLIPECINLLESANSIIKTKIILLFSLIFNKDEVIIKYGEKVFELMLKLRKEKQQFYYYVKIFEDHLIKYCNDIIKYFELISNNKKKSKEVISLLDAFNIIAPYQKVSYALFKTDFLNALINIINDNISNPDDDLITKTFDLIKAFSENPFSVEKNSDFIIKKIFVRILELTLKLNDNYKRFPLNICANILTVILDDDKLYSSTIIDERKTNKINNLIINILPTIYDLLKHPDTVQDSLSFLSLIIERNSAFIKYYRSTGIIDYIFSLMKEENFYSNLNLIKILIKLIESNDTNFDDIIELELIDKVNYLISKDPMEEITIYTEFVIEMFYDLLYKIKEEKKKKAQNRENYIKNFASKIAAVALNFKLCIKLLGCFNTNIQEKVCICIMFILDYFPPAIAETIKINVAFDAEDIPNLLKGLDMNCTKIHKKMINIFMWIIGYQSNAQEILKNYVSFLQSYIEVIRDSSDNKEVVDIASKFLNTVLIKIKS